MKQSKSGLIPYMQKYQVACSKGRKRRTFEFLLALHGADDPSLNNAPDLYEKIKERFIEQNPALAGWQIEICPVSVSYQTTCAYF